MKRISFTLSRLSLRTRAAQNRWIKSKLKEWQLNWNDLFDADQQLSQFKEFDRPSLLPEDIDCDFRLIFGLNRVSSITSAKCFDLFPSGAEMHRRLQNHLLSAPVILGDLDALRIAELIITTIKKIDFRRGGEISGVRVVKFTSPEKQAALSNTDDISILLEKNLLRPHPIENLEQVAARLFLSNPLYALAGNCSHLRDWVASAMVGGLEEELYTQLYELTEGGWMVALGEDNSLLLYQEV